MKKMTIFCLTAFLVLLMSQPTSAKTFSDVPASHSLSIEIEALAADGVISGYSDGTFQPNNPIAKKHIAAMLVRALDLPTTNIKNPGYVDVPITHPYYIEIAAGYTAGLFSKATYFKPESSISRAFMAKLLASGFSLKAIRGNEQVYQDVPTTHPFYNVIQLVTMNNVAQGFPTVKADQTTYAFKPNQLLTRAHFSAFLARAMSLKSGDYAANPAFKYYYEDETSRYHMQFKTRQLGSEETIDTWQFLDELQPNQTFDFIYINSASRWVGDIEAGDVMTHAAKPFTLGTKYDTRPLFKTNPEQYLFASRQRILDTDATITLAGKRYTNVVIIEDTYAIGSTVITYIAPDYGVIAYGDEQQINYWLDERIAMPK